MTKLHYFLNNIGIGGVLVFIATEYNKMKYGKNKPPELEYKLKMAKVQCYGIYLSYYSVLQQLSCWSVRLCICMTP